MRKDGQAFGGSADKSAKVEDSADTLEFKSSGGGTPEQGRRSFCFIVMEGPDKGATYPLTPGVRTIGRLESCDIVVNGRGVSRVHCTVYVKAFGDVVVEDNASTNGVFINGDRILKREIEAGQTLALGPEVKLRLELSANSVQNLLQQMYENATTDSLTGLLTRRGFEERLDVEFAMVRRHKMHCCLAVIDLDHFKKVNDKEGHDAGDLVLQALSAEMKDCVRTGDLACRWGGEEFAIYIRQADLEGGMTLVERLRIRLSEAAIPLEDGRTITVTLSAGVIDLLDFDDWRAGFRRADEALYQAKGAGRNQVIAYSPPAD